MKKNSRDQKIDIQLRVKGRDRHRHTHHLRGVFHQAAAAGVMILARGSRAPKSLAHIFYKRIAERVQARIADFRDCFEDEFPIRVLFLSQFGRALQEFAFFLRR